MGLLGPSEPLKNFLMSARRMHTSNASLTKASSVIARNFVTAWLSCALSHRAKSGAGARRAASRKTARAARAFVERISGAPSSSDGSSTGKVYNSSVAAASKPPRRLLHPIVDPRGHLCHRNSQLGLLRRAADQLAPDVRIPYPENTLPGESFL